MVTAADSKQSTSISRVAADLGRVGQRILCFPFDVAREGYAKSVQVGLVEESMLDGAKFERNLASIELLVLGPWARRV
jgi:hypothetical protein